MVVKTATAGMKGFDVDSIMFPSECAYFIQAGYNFCIRYLPRNSSLIPGNLGVLEMNDILESGLSLGVVQHCPEPGWEPSAELGELYGQYAGTYAKQIGLPQGMNIFLDLETPALNASPQSVIEYANSWYDAIAAAGYSPGVYLGYGLPLSPQQLHDDLKFVHYWRAYNGPDLAIRGYQIVQSTAEVLKGISFDPNIVNADLRGGLPMFLSPS